MSNQMYDTLKLWAQLIIPALATFFVTVFEIWQLPYGVEIGATLMAVDTLLGAVLKKASDKYLSEQQEDLDEIEEIDEENEDEEGEVG